MQYTPEITLLREDPYTITRKLLEDQKRYPDSAGDFTIMVQSIVTACKFISSKVRKAGIAGLYGAQSDQKNATGDTQKKIDVLSNEVFINTLKHTGKCCMLISEEEEKIHHMNPDGKYILAFDPLDGSSNIDCNVSIGSIFGIWKRISDKPEESQALQAGDKLVASGYCCYGSATQIVLCCGGEVNGYTLDPSLGDFILTHPNIRVPESGLIYSINEGNAKNWPEAVTKYVHTRKFPEEGNKGHSLRYIGSMVADVHRTLLYGGVFMYPGDKKSPNGKLRLMYEAAPMAHIMETAGGMATNGRERILALVPTEIHQRAGVIMGSKDQVEEVLDLYKKMDSN